jgi:hypothetical protein
MRADLLSFGNRIIAAAILLDFLCCYIKWLMKRSGITRIIKSRRMRWAGHVQ